MKADISYINGNNYITRYYFVYKFKNYTMAGKNYLYPITPHDLQYSVKHLEDFFEVELVRNTQNNELKFTEYGHILAEQAKKIYEITVTSVALLKQIMKKQGAKMPLLFTTTSDLYEFYIRDAFSAFSRENDGSPITPMIIDQYIAMAKLLNKEIDFTVGIVPAVEDDRFVYKKIGESSVLLAVRKDHIEMFKEMNNLGKLIHRKGAVINHSDPFYDNFHASLNDVINELNIVYYGNNFQSLIEAVRSNFVTYAIVNNYALYKDLRLINITRLFKPVELAFIFCKDNPYFN